MSVQLTFGKATTCYRVLFLSFVRQTTAWWRMFPYWNSAINRPWPSSRRCIVRSWRSMPWLTTKRRTYVARKEVGVSKRRNCKLTALQNRFYFLTAQKASLLVTLLRRVFSYFVTGHFQNSHLLINVVFRIRKPVPLASRTRVILSANWAANKRYFWLLSKMMCVIYRTNASSWKCNKVDIMRDQSPSVWQGRELVCDWTTQQKP